MTSKNLSTPIYIIAFGVILTGLVMGSGFLIPLAIAILIWNILSAIIGVFERVYLPRWLATILSVVLVVWVISFLFHVLAGQADAVREVWPEYVRRIQELFSDLSAKAGADFERDMRAALEKIDLSSQIGAFLGSARSFLTGLILAVLYSGFMFVEARYLPGKIRAIAGSDKDADEVSRILGAMSDSLRSYFGVKTVMSLLVSLVSYAVFKGIGLDFAETWAFLVFLLNFIPNVGSVIAVIFPALLALVQFDQIWPFLMISMVLTAVQMVIGNVVEPMFMGKTLNLSPFVVMVSLVFWGVIWGVIGMFLAVPITVFVMIVCAYLPGLRWIAILLSKEGKLSQ